MSSMLNDTIGTAKDAVQSAKVGTGFAVSSARSTLLDGIQAVGGLVRMIRGLGLDDGLAWIGLSRRRGAFRDLAVFSAGLAVGAGAGLLFAPMSGADTRRAILDQVKGLKKVERDVESKVESKMAEGAEVLKDKVDAAADVVKEKVDAAADVMKDKVDAVADVVTDKAEAAAEAMDRRAGMRSRLYPRDGHRAS
jgi:gas vesicle protein